MHQKVSCEYVFATLKLNVSYSNQENILLHNCEHCYQQMVEQFTLEGPNLDSLKMWLLNDHALRDLMISHSYSYIT